MGEKGDMDQELISYLDKRFDTIEADIRELKIDVKELKGLKKDVHETRILLEGLRGDVQMIAEGLATGFDEGLKPLRSEYDQKIDEIRSIQQLAFSDLRRRVQVLEDWKGRLAGTDPIAMVRERFGLKSKQA
jgi:archaellum component FlaC